MPLIRIGLLPGRTHAQKAELARVITDAVATIAHARPESIIIVFEDIPKENLATGGVLASDRPK